MKWLSANRVELVLRWFLGGLFVYAGVVKALDPMVFLDAVRSYDMLRDPLAAWAAMFLPWLEILAGACLIVNRLYEGALAVLTGAMLVFLVAIATAWARGLDIDCGCFGAVDAGGTYLSYILRDVVLLVIAAWLWWRLRVRSRTAANGLPGPAPA